MRISRRALRVASWRARVVTKTEEGASEASYLPGIPFYAGLYQASGHVDAMLYGERLSYVYHMEYDGPLDIKHNDGICVFVPPEHEPDFRVTAINRDHRPQLFTLEAIQA